jgi:hypothetical protein
LYTLDTSILIALDNGGLLETFLSSAFPITVPDLILAEFAPNEGITPRFSEVEVVEFGGDELGRILAIQSCYGGLSIPDSAALFVAQERQAVLLTGDAPLRRAAVAEHVAVHGVLWILDELLGAALIDTGCACAALERMLAAGARLPPSACNLRFSRWECTG